jgi:hypothetical protein
MLLVPYSYLIAIQAQSQTVDFKSIDLSDRKNHKKIHVNSLICRQSLTVYNSSY